MKIYNILLIVIFLFFGCEAASYQYSADTTEDISANEDSQSCIEGPSPYEWDALMCTEYGEKDLAGNGIETGYCCVWLEEPPMCETPPCSIPMLCQHNLCFWESSCSWELISTTCDQ